MVSTVPLAAITSYIDQHPQQALHPALRPAPVGVVRPPAPGRNRPHRMWRARVAGRAIDRLGHRSGRDRRHPRGQPRLLDRAPRWPRSPRPLLPHQTLRTAIPPARRALLRQTGGKTVFIGRFVAILRVTAAWIAGLSHMDWWRFLAWNAAGGIVWATLSGSSLSSSGAPRPRRSAPTARLQQAEPSSSPSSGCSSCGAWRSV